MLNYRPFTLLLVVVAASACAPDPSEHQATADAAAPVAALPSASLANDPGHAAIVARPEAAVAPVRDGAAPKQYLEQALSLAERNYRVAVERCAQADIVDDCTGAATAALEAEQSAARVEYESRLREVAPGA